MSSGTFLLQWETCHKVKFVTLEYMSLGTFYNIDTRHNVKFVTLAHVLVTCTQNMQNSFFQRLAIQILKIIILNKCLINCIQKNLS